MDLTRRLYGFYDKFIPAEFDINTELANWFFMKQTVVPYVHVYFMGILFYVYLEYFSLSQ